jgi:hypothetical protein
MILPRQRRGPGALAGLGAMLVVADNQQMTFQFMDRQGQMIDQSQLLATP